MNFIRRNGRSLGLVVPLLSLRTGKGPCGEFSDLSELGKLAEAWNMNLVQLLPVNDTGTQTSPYSALSAFALNPIHLRIGELPEAEDGGIPESLRKSIESLAGEFAGAGQVPYGAVLARKLELLREVWEYVMDGTTADDTLAGIAAWVLTHPWVKAYACFIELKREYGGLPWWEWPGFVNPSVADIDTLWENRGSVTKLWFWAWLQMRAEAQFARACGECVARGIDVMGDIPILMNADSADVWFLRDFFDTGLSAGAPPDMYASLGQNWGFPLYRWDEMARSGHAFWKERLASASAFYTAYRIDHVLGFFRIWATGKRERDGFLGRFEPEYRISYPELSSLGFDNDRIRWLSLPHVPGWALAEALGQLPPPCRAEIAAKLFVRIGSEDLFLFSSFAEGGADISETVRSAAAEALASGLISWPSVTACEDALLGRWRDRTLLEVAPGQYVPTWEYEGTQAWKSLAEGEKTALQALIRRRKGESLNLWEKTGRNILKVLVDCVSMQACAEDLGAVPPCVPTVLSELGIPGLRVLRWNRQWDRAGSPFVPLGEYPEETVACTSVHDSSMLRQWWEEEADRPTVWEMVRKAHADHAGASLPSSEPPESLSPEDVLALLRAVAGARSRLVVFPVQDLLAASARHRETLPRDERINVPGTSNESNWLYRMKPSLEALLADEALARRLSELWSWRN